MERKKQKTVKQRYRKLIACSFACQERSAVMQLIAPNSYPLQQAFPKIALKHTANNNKYIHVFRDDNGRIVISHFQKVIEFYKINRKHINLYLNFIK